MFRYLYRQLLVVVLALCAGAAPRLHAQPANAAAPVRGAIVGEVREEPGDAPVSGITIRIDETNYQTVSGAEGLFHLQNVPRGVYRVFVTGEGYEPQEIREVTVGDQMTRLRISLRRRTVLTRDLVSTVSGRQQPMTEAPASVSVLSGPEISARGINSIDQVIERIPGAAMNGEQVDIRGASGSTLGAGSRAMLLFDGMPLITADNGRLPLDAVPSVLIDQVEVVRSTGSTLYGSGGVSGTINIIPRRAPEGMHGRTRIYGGLFPEPTRDDWVWWGDRTQRFIGGEALLTQRTDALGMTFAGSLGSDESYRQFDDSQRYKLFGSLGWAPADNTDIRLTAFTSHKDHGGYYLWSGVDDPLSAATPADTLSPVTTSTTMIFGRMRRTISQEFSYSVHAGLVASDLDDERRKGDPQRLQSLATGYFAGADVTMAISPLVGVTWGGGVRYDDVISTTYGNHQQRTLSLHAQTDFSNRDDITAMVRMRLDAINEMATGREELHLSPSVGVSYRPTDETSFRVLLGRGFRMPTIAERHVDAVIEGATLLPNPKLYSEVVWHGEMGFAQGMTVETLKLRADCALYVDEYFSMIEPILNPADGNITFMNVTRGRMLGVDMQLRGDLPGTGLSFTSDLDLVSARNLKLNTLLPLRPASTGHFSLIWQEGAFSAIGDYRYVERIDTIDSALLRVVPDATSRNSTHNFDLHFGYDIQQAIDFPLTIRLHVRNLLQHYHTDGIGNLGPIRSFEIGIEGKF